MHVAPLLFTAAAGYWVLERAERQRGRTKTLGRVIAALILVISFVGVACRLYYVIGCQKGGKVWCPYKSAPQSEPRQ